MQNVKTTTINDWKWYEQNNFVPNNSALNCYVTNNMNIVEVKVPAAQPGSFSKTTKPDADNTIKQLQFSFWAGGSYIPNLSCKYIVMAKKDGPIIFPKILPEYICWSDPYIVMTEGGSGTGPLRKEVIEESINKEIEILLDAEVYPNPTEGKITVKIPASEGFLTLVDAQGKQVSTYNLLQQTTSLDISQFPDGLYNLLIALKDKTYSFKLIISK